jgi:hypothetical protein
MMVSDLHVGADPLLAGAARESRNTPEDFPKEAPCQAARGSRCEQGRGEGGQAESILATLTISH